MLNRVISQIATWAIRVAIRLTGRTVFNRQLRENGDEAWLASPLGPRGRIGAGYYEYLSEQENLSIAKDESAGLLRSFDALRGPDFDPNDIHDDIRDFYEHTACYDLDVWSEANLLTRGFLWALTRFVSREMEQLNFPTSSLELASGMTSEVIPLLDESGERVYTGWLRRVVATQRVIYTGLYTTESVPGHKSPCVKVSFPLPLGSATVCLRPVAESDGSLKLISQGKRFGDPGFYRVVTAGEDRCRVRYMKTLHEFFHVYVDELGCLRTEHRVRFFGLTVLQLHYKMQRKSPRVEAAGRELVSARVYEPLTKNELNQ